MVMVVCFILNKFTFSFHFALGLSSTCSFIKDFDWHLLSYIELYQCTQVSEEKSVNQLTDIQ